MHLATRSRVQVWLAGLALCVITALAYRNSFEAGFTFDNRLLILSDSRVHQATAENVQLILSHTYAWPATEAGLYRPLTTLSYLFNYAILGNTDHPAGYHAINLLLHLVNVLLVFALARRLLRDFWRPILVTALWAVHPVLTESVTNIVGRADLLAGMSTIGGLLLYLKSTEAHGWRRFACLAGLGLLTFIGVFSKESAVVVIAVIALYEFTWPFRERVCGLAIAIVGGTLAMTPAFVAMWLTRASVLSQSGPALFPFTDNPITGANFWIGRLTALKVLAKYLDLLLWPINLSSDYSYPQIPLADGRFTDWLAWLAIAAFVALVAWAWRHNKAAFFAAGFALIAILPTSNLLIPVGTIMAERFLYLPAIGFAIGLVLTLGYATRHFHLPAPTPFVIGVIIVAAFGTRTYLRNADWQDDFTLWSAAARTAPLSVKVHLALGQQLLQPAHYDPERGIAEEEHALSLLDSLPDELNEPPAYVRVGSQYVSLGERLRRRSPDGSFQNTPESIKAFERAEALMLRCITIIEAHHRARSTQASGFAGVIMKTESTNQFIEVAAHLVLADSEWPLGKLDDALRSAREAQAVGPTSVLVYRELYGVLRTAGRTSEASDALLEGVLLTHDPGLQHDLIQDWAKNPDTRVCDVSFAHPQPEIDPSCPVFRGKVCALRDEVVRLSRAANGSEAAALTNEELAVKYGCATTQ